MNSNTLFDPTNLWNIPTNDLANDFVMICLVHKTINCAVIGEVVGALDRADRLDQ